MSSAGAIPAAACGHVDVLAWTCDACDDSACRQCAHEGRSEEESDSEDEGETTTLNVRTRTSARIALLTPTFPRQAALASLHWNRGVGAIFVHSVTAGTAMKTKSTSIAKAAKLYRATTATGSRTVSAGKAHIAVTTHPPFVRDVIIFFVTIVMIRLPAIIV